jgi:hypothetical protein
LRRPTVRRRLTRPSMKASTSSSSCRPSVPIHLPGRPRFFFITARYNVRYDIPLPMIEPAPAGRCGATIFVALLDLIIITGGASFLLSRSRRHCALPSKKSRPRSRGPQDFPNQCGRLIAGPGPSSPPRGSRCTMGADSRESIYQRWDGNAHRDRCRHYPHRGGLRLRTRRL